MNRISITERPNLAQAAAEHELEYTPGTGITGWDESACYQFTTRQIEADLSGSLEELEGLCFQVVDRAVSDEAVMRRLGIAEPFWDYIAESWRNNERNLYGRMDLSYDGKGPAKLLEYNADTPTALYETAVFQWEWLEQAAEQGLIPQGCDQFNEVHECIVQAFPHMGIEALSHFACNHDIEDDKGTLDYLEECAREAGLETCSLAMGDIGLDEQGRFTDLENRVITTLIKLYPWEWIMDEAFGRHLPTSGVQFIEPPWKAILSNKGMLALLWEMFEGHPNLLPSFFEGDTAAAALADTGRYVRKPQLSRQGANIEIVDAGETVIKSDGPYGEDPHILQDFHPLPEFHGRYPLVGCWLVASKAVGLCIREDSTLVTGKDSRVIPHVVLD
jgi:glutathionylspermidine synthase